MINKEKTQYPRKSYTIADYYISYKNYIEEGTRYDVDLKTFKSIVVDYFKYLRDEVMLHSKEMKLPCRLGTLQIIKSRPVTYTSKSLSFDWKATKELGKCVFLLNEHSNGWKYRFYWSKSNCIIPNKTMYMFVATRTNKRDLAQLIFRKKVDYPEV